MEKPFVATLEADKVEKLRTELCARGFEMTTPPHTLFQAKKKGLTCTLYSSLKLTVQGKEMQEFIEFFLEPEILERFSHSSPKQHDHTAKIGVDEAGKGDFFGPLCIAAVFAADGEVQELLRLGVKDSKELSDPEVMQISRAIQARFKHSLIRIFPLKYNELYNQFKNLNKLLAWGHATAIENLVKLSNCKTVLIDQFAGEHEVIQAVKKKGLDIDLTQKTKGEEDPVVAAASILARAAFLDGLEKLGKEINFKLPKGASKPVIEAGKRLVAERGAEILQQVSKQHFRSTHDVLGTEPPPKPKWIPRRHSS